MKSKMKKLLSIVLLLSLLSPFAGGLLRMTADAQSDWKPVAGDWDLSDGAVELTDAKGATAILDYTGEAGDHYTATFRLVKPSGSGDKNEILFYFSDETGENHRYVVFQWNGSEMVLYDSDGRAYWMAGGYNAEWYAQNAATEYPVTVTVAGGTLSVSATNGIEARTVDLASLSWKPGAAPAPIRIAGKPALSLELKDLLVDAVMGELPFETTQWTRDTDGWSFENGVLQANKGYQADENGYYRAHFSAELTDAYRMNFTLVRPVVPGEMRVLRFSFAREDGQAVRYVDFMWDNGNIVLYDSDGRAYWIAGSYNASAYAASAQTEFAFEVAVKDGRLSVTVPENMEARTVELSGLTWKPEAAKNTVSLAVKSGNDMQMKAITVTAQQPDLPDLPFETTQWTRDTDGWSFENGVLKTNKGYPADENGYYRAHYTAALSGDYEMDFTLLRPQLRGEMRMLRFAFESEDGGKYVDFMWSNSEVVAYDSDGAAYWVAGSYNTQAYAQSRETEFAFHVSVAGGRLNIAVPEGMEARSVNLNALTWRPGLSGTGISVSVRAADDMELKNISVSAAQELPQLPFDSSLWNRVTDGWSLQNGSLELHREYPSDAGNFYLDYAQSVGENYTVSFDIVRPDSRLSDMNMVTFFFDSPDKSRHKSVSFQWNGRDVVLYDSDGAAYWMAGDYNAEWYAGSSSKTFPITIQATGGKLQVSGGEGFEKRTVELSSLQWVDGASPAPIRIAGGKMELKLQKLTVTGNQILDPLPDGSDLNGVWRQTHPGWTYQKGVIEMTHKSWSNENGYYYLDYIPSLPQNFMVKFSLIKPAGHKRNQCVFYFSNGDMTQHKSVSLEWGAQEAVVLDSDGGMHWMAGNYNPEWYANLPAGTEFQISVYCLDGQITFKSETGMEKRTVALSSLSWKDGKAPAALRLAANQENDFRIRNFLADSYSAPEIRYFAEDWKEESGTWSYDDGVFHLIRDDERSEDGHSSLTYQVPLGKNYNLDFDIQRPAGADVQQSMLLSFPLDGGKDAQNIRLLWTANDFAVYPSGQKDGHWLAGLWNKLSYAQSDKETFHVKIRVKEGKITVGLEDNETATIHSNEMLAAGEAFQNYIQMDAKSADYVVKNVVVEDKDNGKTYYYVGSGYEKKSGITQITGGDTPPADDAAGEIPQEGSAADPSQLAMMIVAIALPLLASGGFVWEILFLKKKAAA